MKTIQREGGVERQFRWNCATCGVPVAYESAEWGQAILPILYILVIYIYIYILLLYI